MTVQADVVPGVEASTVVKQLRAGDRAVPRQAAVRLSVVAGGTVEDSAKAQASIFVVFPLMLFLMMTILMVQLMSFQRLLLVLRRRRWR